MTIEEMHKWFDLIIDETSSPYFTSNEKDSFLQRAEIIYVNNFFNGRIDQTNAELTSVDSRLLQPLTELVEIETGNDGKALISLIDPLLSPSSLMYVLNLFQGGVVDCTISKPFTLSRYTNHNNIGKALKNAFKTPTEDHPVHTYFNGYFQLYPVGKKKVQLTVIKKPRKITLDDPNDTGQAGINAVNSELLDQSHNDVLLIALRNAGIPIRDESFYQMIGHTENKE